MKTNLLSMAIRSVTLVAIGVAPAFAQAQEVDVNETPILDENIEQIVVTGSRILRPNAESQVPVTSVTAEDLSLSGDINMGDFLSKLPQIRSTYISANAGRFIGTTGLNLLDLRGLGASRTLVLQDGRRHIGSTQGSSSVDINAIPEDLIDRVDVVTSGASAVYGADAVSGTVNFILKDNFEGVKISAFSSDTENGGGGASEMSLTFGKNFFDGRANIAGSIQHSRRDEVLAEDRDWIARAPGTFRNPLNTGENDGIPDWIPIENRRNPELNRAGILWGIKGDKYQPLNYTFNPDGSMRPTVPGVCDSTGTNCIGGDGYAFVDQNQMFPDLEGYNLFLKGHFDISDSMRIFGEIKYTNNKAESFDQATFDQPVPIEVSSANPFLDPDAAAIVKRFEDDGVIPVMFRMNNDLGLRGELTERETQRYVLGLKGDISGSWSYETSLVYGKYNGDINFVNNRVLDNYIHSLDITELDGEIVCADAEARANGCAPLNLFGEGRASQEAIDYIMRQDTGADEEMTQFVASGFVTGELFQLPAGPLQVVAGLEYREETSSNDYSEIIQADSKLVPDERATFMNQLTPAKGEYDVREAFFEFSVPLLSDLPGIQRLAFDTAYRVSDYSTVGGTDAFSAGFDWVIVEDLRLRATFSQVVRAPNIGELFQPLRGNFASIKDPCDALQQGNGPNPKQRKANCAALGVSSEYESPFRNLTMPFEAGGNPDLEEETADTFTYGLVFTPRFAEGLTITVDYWDIEIENAINAYKAQDILNKCVDGDSINNQFCSFITRAANGDLVTLISENLNASALTARGIDYEMRYEFALSELFNTSDLGSLSLSLIGSHLMDRTDYPYQDEPNEGDRIHRELGDPINSFNTGVTYRHEGLSVNWTHRYLGNMAQYELEDAPKEQARVASYNTGSMHYNDLRVSYLFGDTLEVYSGINNIEDKEPPANLSGITGGSGIYDTLGRSFYVGANYTF